MTRRSFLLGAAALGAIPALVLPAPAAATVASAALPGGRVIWGRDTWGAALPPVGPLAPEPDVRFLMVHHTAGPNDYSPDEVPATLRSIYGFHTSAEKGWPDVAYNFFVDRHGGLWEGHAGSLAGAVQGDATGGSQGFAQLCCFLGNHSTALPTDEATESMLLLLAWLADRHGLDTSPGATTTFSSRGSNLWPPGATVTTATIAGHRDLSATECPGDLLYPAVRDRYPAEVTARRLGAAASEVEEPVTTLPAEAASSPSTEPTSTPTTERVPVTTTSPPVPDGSALGAAPSPPSPGGSGPGDALDPRLLAAAAAGLAAAGGAGIALGRARHARSEEDARP